MEAAREKMVTLEAQLSTSSKEYNDLKAAVAKVKTVEIDLAVEVQNIFFCVECVCDLEKGCIVDTHPNPNLTSYFFLLCPYLPKSSWSACLRS